MKKFVIPLLLALVVVGFFCSCSEDGISEQEQKNPTTTSAKSSGMTNFFMAAPSSPRIGLPFRAFFAGGSRRVNVQFMTAALCFRSRLFSSRRYGLSSGMLL